MKVFIFLTILLTSLPIWAQFYSYKDANGRLHITDRPLKGKGLKLVKTFVPKDLRKRPTAPVRQSKAKKFVLSDTQIFGLVHPLATAMRVDPALVEAVIQVESGRNAYAKSNKGAMGLMQLIPATAERFGVENPWDPRQNVKGGIRYLQYLLSYFKGNVDYVLAAYNAGEHAVDRHQGVPPYKETQRYLKKVRSLYAVSELPFGGQAKYHSPLVAGQPR